VNSSSSDYQTLLASAADAKRPTPAVMVAALSEAEQTARQQKSVIPFESLLGEWRLCFATGASKKKGRQVKLGRGYYLPKFIPASIAFTQDAESALTGTVTNKLLVGSIYIQFTGPCRYPGKKNLLVFDFTQIQLKVLGLPVYQGKIRSGKDGIKDFAKISIADLPFFAFFWAGENSIAARGRGGGLALWVRDRSTPALSSE
jgi:hypothetical protein